MTIKKPRRQFTQFIEEVVDQAASMYNDRRKEIMDTVGDRPYGARKLSAEEELTRYREEQRHDRTFWEQFIKDERERLGLESTMADGRPLIPKTVIKEMVRLEKRHRGKEEE